MEGWEGRVRGLEALGAEPSGIKCHFSSKHQEVHLQHVLAACGGSRPEPPAVEKQLEMDVGLGMCCLPASAAKAKQVSKPLRSDVARLRDDFTPEPVGQRKTPEARGKA